MFFSAMRLFFFLYGCVLIYKVCAGLDIKQLPQFPEGELRQLLGFFQSNYALTLFSLMRAFLPVSLRR